MPAKPEHAKRWDLSKVDGWFGVVQWIWERLSTFALSSAGAALMAYLASITKWMAVAGPVAWGGVGLAAFLAIYLSIAFARRALSAGRRDRVASLIAEETIGGATVNPLERHFRHQRIALRELYDPFGDPVEDRTFVGCDLIGPAVILLEPSTVFRRNSLSNVEFMKIPPFKNYNTRNKIVLLKSTIDGCRISDVIFLITDSWADTFESSFGEPIPWINDPSITGEDPEVPPQLSIGSETQP